mgnify:CR=1 FL=1|tara:strand:+ start:113 stop:499 length:387 start_codon:yes stop_codon:yes gene_type:complete
MNQKTKNLHLTKSSYDFAKQLTEEGVFSELGKAFQFALSFALKVNPNIKEDINSSEYKSLYNIAVMTRIDEGGIFSWVIKTLSHQVDIDDINKRIRFLGCWGLNQIESKYWDNDLKLIKWEELDKDTK